MNTTATGTCGKCGGSGKLLAFSHIANGECFTCNGAGTVTAYSRQAPQLSEAERIAVADETALALVRVAAAILSRGLAWEDTTEAYMEPQNYRAIVSECSPSVRRECNAALRNLMARGLRVVSK